MGRRKYDREHVASILVEAIGLGLPIVETLRSMFDMSDQQARYIAGKVRDEGLLGAPPHTPARATVHRGTLREKSWVACGECTERWPCPHAFPFGRHDSMKGPVPDVKERRAAERERLQDRRVTRSRPRAVPRRDAGTGGN